jgi:ubiquitin C-terminal hydrolase
MEQYSLQGVLVHNGMFMNSGHYVTFRNSGTGWIQYDDEHVSREYF